MENANKNEETIETAATVTVVAVDDADQTSTTTAEIQTNEVKKNKKHKKKSKKSKNTEVVNVETKVQALTETTKNLTISDQTANNSTLTSTSNAEQTTSTTTTTATAANNNSNYDNLQKAVQILGNAKAKDEAKQFDAALKLYRQGVDMLLEELIERQGTNESRTYLRNKCNDFMNRIDQIKLLLEIEAKTKLKENLEKNEKQISV